MEVANGEAVGWEPLAGTNACTEVTPGGRWGTHPDGDQTF
jgi:hypothetical protein